MKASPQVGQELRRQHATVEHHGRRDIRLSEGA